MLSAGSEYGSGVQNILIGHRASFLLRQRISTEEPSQYLFIYLLICYSSMKHRCTSQIIVQLGHNRMFQGLRLFFLSLTLKCGPILFPFL